MLKLFEYKKIECNLKPRHFGFMAKVLLAAMPAENHDFPVTNQLCERVAVHAYNIWKKEDFNYSDLLECITDIIRYFH